MLDSELSSAKIAVVSKGGKVQISELVRRADVPLATVKFYIREGMLPAGHAVGARRADYDEGHLDRLRLIRSLTVVAGLPLNRAKKILDIIDHPEGSVYEMLGRAIEVLADGPDEPGTSDTDMPSYPRAQAALTQLGDAYADSHDRMSAFAQLDRALLAVEKAGMPVSPALLRLYGERIAAIARAELAAMPQGNPSAAIQYAVLGTILYEPVLAAIRRLAHQNLATELGW